MIRGLILELVWNCGGRGEEGEGLGWILLQKELRDWPEMKYYRGYTLE